MRKFRVCPPFYFLKGFVLRKGKRKFQCTTNIMDGYVDMHPNNSMAKWRAKLLLSLANAWHHTPNFDIDSPCMKHHIDRSMALRAHSDMCNGVYGVVTMWMRDCKSVSTF